MWNHYADKHRGIALGFDVDENKLRRVSYRKTRPVLKKNSLTSVPDWLLFTKYDDWRYEQEARIYTTLNDRDPGTGFYFGDFSEQLVLREVMRGRCARLQRESFARQWARHPRSR
jgi:hypothetical protein